MEQENNLIPEEQVNLPESSEISVATETEKKKEQTGSEVIHEKKEIPEIDFSTLSTAQIVQQVQKLLNDYPVASLKEVMENLPEIFESKYKEEYNQALAIFHVPSDSF